MFTVIICERCRKELEITDESNERDGWWENDEPTHVIFVKPHNCDERKN